MSLAVANGKRDLDVSFNYSHVGDINSGAFFFNMQIPIFDRNQGEIARTHAVITQSQELAAEANEQVMSDVVNAYEGVHTNDQIIGLFRSGYLDQSTQSRDISQYAYQRGAASLLDFLDAERSYRANQLAYRQALAELHALARTTPRSGGNQESAMKFHALNLVAGAAALALCGCGASTSQRESQMTSYTAGETKADTANLFTLPSRPDGARADRTGGERQPPASTAAYRSRRL